MDDLFVARLMSTTLHTVDPDTLVETAAETMLEDRVGSLLVVDEEGHLEGVLTTTDFVWIVAERQPKDRTPVSRYMTTDVVTAGAQDTVQAAADAMIENGFHHLPVVDQDGVAIGMVTTTDLAAYISEVEDSTP